MMFSEFALFDINHGIESLDNSTTQWLFNYKLMLFYIIGSIILNNCF